MPTKLLKPVEIKTAFGPIAVTHEFHTLHLIDTPDDSRYVSTVRYGVEVDGVVTVVPNTETTVDIIGAERESLGDDPTVSAIKAMHDVVVTRLQAEKLAAAQAEQAELAARTAENARALAEASAPRPVASIGADKDTAPE